ncbi:MAG: Flp family type IVb pilin [Leisingera sp.]
MTAYLKKMLSRLRRDERGVTLVEYGISLALAVALGTAALDTLAGDVGGAMAAAGAEMPGGE